ncbi:MAG: DUF4157 domain-containing protein, partial [Candidatus Latescibacteria bacterium]|nr:DUF4157 domain-containing protein [Candidatus Latescibacterota bacterium]
ADAVMRMPEPQVQRQVEEEEEEILQTKPLVGQITPLVQRQVEEEEDEEEMLQAKSREDATSEVTNDFESQINAIKGGGRPMAESERAYFEPRFGRSFAHVQVHDDAVANAMAGEINAQAFAFGKDIVFGSGRYRPQTHKGCRLIAHELAHVVQQNRAGRPSVARYPSPHNQDFWEDLRQDVHDVWYQPVLSTDERALQQFETDLGAHEESPSGNLALDAVDFALDLAQAHPAAKFGIKLLKHVYDHLEATRSATIQLADFSNAQRLAHQAFERRFPADLSQVDDDSEELLQRLLALKNGENDANRTQQREAAVRMLDSARRQIPSFHLVMQQLIRAWVAGAADQPWAEATVDLPDPAGFSTGYLRIYAHIETDAYLRYRRHRFSAISIDDIDAPTGTKTAIRHAFGNMYLDELPFPGRILLRMGSTYVIYEKRSRGATDDLQGWTVSTSGVQPRFEESTIEGRRQLYFDRIRPRVEHLQPDD